jgi:hypothetical protein
VGRRKPERDQVEKLLKENRGRRAHDIAEEVGLVATMGYEKAVDYVRRVRKEMRKSGELPRKKYTYPSDADRMVDIDKLFELRHGRKVSRKVARSMLKLNCYYRLRSEDDDTHIRAIDDTYAKCREMNINMAEAIKICEFALGRYSDSMDDEMNQAAISLGFPGAGMNYTSQSLIDILEITEEELQYMKSIRRG